MHTIERLGDFGEITRTPHRVERLRGEGAAPPPVALSETQLVEIVDGAGLTRWSLVSDLTEKGVTTLRGLSTERVRGDLGDLVTSVIDLVGLDDVEKAAAKGVLAVVKALEGRFYRDAGVHLLPSTDDALRHTRDWRRVDPSHTGRRFALLLHGTFSHPVASFGGLAGSSAWRALLRVNPDGVLALTAPTMGESPIASARRVLDALPDDAALDVLSYSRGGLIGELLAKGPDPLDKKLVAALATRHKDEDGWADQCEKLNEELAEYQKLRKAKALTVVRHTRVAAPLGGTPLAGAKLDVVLSVLLNAIGWIPAVKATPWYGFVKRTVLEIIKRRRSFAELPGLAVMDPDSPMLRALAIRGASGVPTHRVAGDIEGGSWLGRLAVAATDLFFGEDHDLVVPTRSSFVDVPAPLDTDVVIRGPEVNHFAYFSDERVQGAIGRARGVSDDAPRGEAVVAFDALGVTAPWRDPPENPGADVVFLLPGILGTELWHQDGSTQRRIWPDLGAIVRGDLTKLRFRQGDGVFAGSMLVSIYQDLALRLGEHFDLRAHGFDWRRPIEALAGDLAAAVKAVDGDRRVHFVCHSMGGLVAMEMFRRNPQVLPAQRRGRVVLLGTPTWGAAKPILALGGEDDLVGKLALADLVNREAKIIDVLRSFPGLLQMTWREAREDQTAWKKILAAVGVPGSDNAYAGVHALAAAYWDRRHAGWRSASPDAIGDIPEIIYVAGVGHRTPDAAWVTPKGKVQEASSDDVRGDGTVTWARGFDSAFMKRQYWVDATHAVIPREIDPRAVIELVATGETARLFTEAPPRRVWDFITRGDPREATPLAEPRRLPTEDELAGAPAPRALTTNAPADAVACSVVHGSLHNERDPVVLVVFDGEALTTQALVLDRVLRGDGARVVDSGAPRGELRRAYELGIWPRGAGSHRVVRARDLRDLDNDAAREVVLVNVGPQWMLTRRGLRDALTTALRAYLYERCVEDRATDGVALSVGILGVDGRERIGVEEAVAIWVEAAVCANRALRRRSVKGYLASLRFVEPYRDIAARAAHALQSLETWLALRLRPDELRLREGVRVKEGYFGAAPPSLGAWETWDRVEITGRDGGADLELRMRFGDGGASRFGSRARVSRGLVASARREGRARVYDLDALAAQLRAITTTAQRDALTSGAGLVLELDVRAAAIPWEALLSQALEGELEARDALLRVRRGERRVFDKRAATADAAFVLGAPGTQEPAELQLPAAAAEVATLRGLFEDNRPASWTVRGGTGLSSDKVLLALTDRAYRVLHIASHGRVSADGASEVYIGDGRWRGTDLIDQLEALPQLVFLNCCHLGQAPPDPALFAANLAEGFLARGVRAMVVAGWEVADNAARTFAEVFYGELLAGETFGRAVRVARRETRVRHPSVSSWAAFQCYGEPGFVLVPEARLERRLRAKAVPCADPQEAVDLLIALHGDARVLGEARRGEIRDALARNLAAWSPFVRGDGEVLHRAAMLWLDLGEIDNALAIYERLVPALQGADAPPGPRSFRARGVEWAMTTLSRVAWQRRADDRARALSAARADRAVGLAAALRVLWPSDPVLANVVGHVVLRRAALGADATRAADLDAAQAHFDFAAQGAAAPEDRARHALDAAWLRLASTGDVSAEDRVRAGDIALDRGDATDTFAQRARAEVRLLRYALDAGAHDPADARFTEGVALLRALLTGTAARMWRDVVRELFEALRAVAASPSPRFAAVIDAVIAALP